MLMIALIIVTKLIPVVSSVCSSPTTYRELTDTYCSLRQYLLRVQ